MPFDKDSFYIVLFSGKHRNYWFAENILSMSTYDHALADPKKFLTVTRDPARAKWFSFDEIRHIQPAHNPLVVNPQRELCLMEVPAKDRFLIQLKDEFDTTKYPLYHPSVYMQHLHQEDVTDPIDISLV